MGATASRSSSSPPSSCATAKTKHYPTTTTSPPTSCPMVKTEHSETRLFKITEFPESATLPPGSTLTLDTFQFRGQGWRVDLKPVGSLACLDSVTVSVTIVADHGWNYPENTRTRVSIDILDERGERAVFDHRRTQSQRNEGFGFLSVGKTELEASSCLRDDCLTVRCTLSVDVFEPKVDLAHIVEPRMMADMPSSHRDTVPTVRTDSVGAAASVPAASLSTAKSHAPQPTCGFGWLAGGRLRRRRLRDVFGIRRYRHVNSSIDDASTRDGSESNRTPLLSGVHG